MTESVDKTRESGLSTFEHQRNSICALDVNSRVMALLKDTKNLSWSQYLRYLIFRIVLWLTKKSRKSRFAELHDLLDNDPFKYGALCSSKEVEEEWPYSNAKMVTEKKNDIVSIFCTSKNGQILTVNMIRTPNKTASVFVYLKTLQANYTLSKQFFVDLSTEDTFAVDVLKLECVIPLKKWRFSFNGLLKNDITGNEDHVRFVFTPSVINEQLNQVDAVVQTYSFVGQVRVKENSLEGKTYEEQVFAFGNKNRSHEIRSSAAQTLGSFMAYTENGISLLLEEFDLAKFTSSLAFGVIHYPSFYHAKLEVLKTDVMKPNNIAETFEIAGDNVPLASVKVCEQLLETKFIHEFNSEFRERKVRVFKITYDDKDGYAVYFGGFGDRVQANIPVVPSHLLKSKKESAQNVLRFEDETCSNEALTGGKASSLAVLIQLSKNCQKFAVANGLAVTTNAYAEFTKLPKVASAIHDVTSAVKQLIEPNELKVICERSVDTIGAQEIPEIIENELKTTLEKMYPQIDEVKFAVRSSACGEDSEEMSAAGQMETLLGVKGFSNICKAVAKCWASQFSFVAVQYRRRYGQLINCPMAVCVQEMVNSEVSGVMFTVDPVAANPKYITITANYGLGESVVSAAADPDTFIIDKVSGKVTSSTIGEKKLRTVMLEEGGTKDITDSEKSTASNKACLSETQLTQLTEAALEVEKHYASQRDTEWAFAPGGKQLYMLQARPVTSAHVLDIEFEFLHERDASLLCDLDCVSKANVGEVFGGSTSPLSLELFHNLDRNDKLQDIKNKNEEVWEQMFARQQFFISQNGQCFFATWTDAFDFSERDMMSKGFMISLNGRIIDDEVMMKGAFNKKRYARRPARMSPITVLIGLWKAHAILAEGERVVSTSTFSLKDCETSKEKFLKLLSYPNLFEAASDGHGKEIFYGSINNICALALLASSEGDMTTKVFSDFARIVASCNNLVSADVPLSLQKISIQAFEDYGLSFKELSDEEVLSKLQSDNTETARLFAKFLKEHGHRCLREFDLSASPWVLNPIPVVKTIRSMVGATELTHRPEISIPELLKTMEIKLKGWKALAFRYFVGNVRIGVANRERGKSCLIMCCHKYRMWLREIADKMVEEGFIPEPDLIFYLSFNEIWLLLKTRNPKIVIRAFNRRRNVAKTDGDMYPELTAGLPLKPMNRNDDTVEAKGSRQMKGTPVSQGSVTATARVIMTLEEADQIQKGDILITYATDIGWSPYFPLLGGIVTELGGLISHGAVVAREYGLPCMVGAHGATRLFKSGEKVYLNGTEGILQTVE